MTNDNAVERALESDAPLTAAFLISHRLPLEAA
jgi:hypothetical protein